MNPVRRSILMNAARALLGLSVAGAAALLPAACGSGIIAEGIGSGGTGGGIVIGSILGFGSVIVNGVKFDDTAARVTINGIPDRPVSELKLGMVVQVNGTIDSGGATGKASEITTSLAVQGPVDAVNAAANSVWVLGQRVRVDAGTVFDGFDKLDALSPGDVIAVSGLRDASAGAVAATRIERRPATDAATQVQGVISGLAAGTFRLDNLTVSYAGAQLVGVPPSGLANGLLVTVQGAMQSSSGTLVASTVRVVSTALPAGATVELAGFIASYVSPASFMVGTLTVDATAAKFTGGTAANLANGARVEVEGTVVNGVLAATEVDFLAPGAEALADVEGPVTSFISQANFQVRGQTVDATFATFTAGDASALANGRVVHVTGMVSGSVLLASAVAFEDTTPPEATRLAVDGLITGFISAGNFHVNGQAVATNAATVFSGGGPGDLANGRRVAAEGVVSNGILVAATVSIYPLDVPPTVTTSGRISSFASPASFVVNGQAVTAGTGTAYTGGTVSQLANGVSVTVTGTLVNGVLHAASIQFAASGTGQGEPAEVEGYITNFVSVSNFKVQGQVVDASGAAFSGGTAAQLANGLKVQATGPVSGGILRATRVEIDD